MRNLFNLTSLATSRPRSQDTQNPPSLGQKPKNQPHHFLGEIPTAPSLQGIVITQGINQEAPKTPITRPSRRDERGAPRLPPLSPPGKTLRLVIRGTPLAFPTSDHSAHFSVSVSCTDHQKKTVRLLPMMGDNPLGESIAQPNLVAQHLCTTQKARSTFCYPIRRWRGFSAVSNLLQADSIPCRKLPIRWFVPCISPPLKKN